MCADQWDYGEYDGRTTAEIRAGRPRGAPIAHGT